MKRQIVQVARARAMDARPGDVVSRDPDTEGGWFQLTTVNELHDGRLNLTDGGVQNSFSLGPLDLIGIQFIRTVEVEPQPDLPDFGTAGANLDDNGGADGDAEAEAELDDPAAHRREPALSS